MNVNSLVEIDNFWIGSAAICPIKQRITIRAARLSRQLWPPLISPIGLQLAPIIRVE
jgi:hypothetical protein